MADTTIRIVFASGTFTYKFEGTPVDASSTQITRKSKLRWICNLPLAVFFKDGRTAMANGAHVLCAEPDEFTKSLQVKDLANGNPPFRYGVAVLDSTNTIQEDDPNIIIDDGLGGGGGTPLPSKSGKAAKKKKSK